MALPPRPLADRFLEKYRVNTITGCWDWTASVKRNGYGQIGLLRKPKPTMIEAHRASWMIHRGKIPPGKYVLHRCDVKTCVNPDHLWLGTQRQNVQDMLQKGRGNNDVRPSGEQHYAARLTWAQVCAIRADTRTQVVIAAEYGIKQGTVSGIKKFRKWRRDP